MKIRLTKTPKLPKAQSGGQGEPTSITINGVTYYPGQPGFEQAKKEASQAREEGDALRAEVNSRMSGFKPAQPGPVVNPTSKLTVPNVAPFQQPVTLAAAPATGFDLSNPSGMQMFEPANNFKSVFDTPFTAPVSISATAPKINPPAAAQKQNTSAAATPDFYKTLGQAAKNTKLITAGLSIANQALTSIFDNPATRYKEQTRQLGMTDNLSTPQAADRGDYVQTGMMTGTLRPDEYVANKGMFAAAGGSLNTPTMKIRIVGSPEQMKYGGQVKPGGSLDVGGRKVYTDMTDSPFESVGKTMPEVSPEEANLEAEKGETILADVDNDGVMEHMNIEGKSHANGGTLLNAPEGSFIYSKKLKEKDPEILGMFNKSFKKGGIAYADIAKQYNINKYKAIMEDPNADPIAKSTAQMMVKNYERKLAQLALAQESSKGFPQGIPQVAEAALPQQAAYGGMFYGAAGVEVNSSVDPYMGNRDKKKTPTGMNNKYSKGKDYVSMWESYIPGISKMDNKKAQKLIYEYSLSKDPDTVENMWKGYGLTKAGLNNKDLAAFSDLDANGKPTGRFSKDLTSEQLRKLEMAYTDGFFGDRTIDPNTLKRRKPEEIVRMERRSPVVPGAPTFLPKFTPNITPEKKAQPVNVPFDYMAPDKLAMLTSLMNPPQTYNPFYAPVNLTKPEPTFYDPSRELAANSEIYNQTVAGAANFGNPQAYMANASKASGDALSNAANIMGRYNNLNVGVANQFNPMQAETANKQALFNAERANQTAAGYATAGQNTQNSRRDFIQNATKTYANAFNNRMNLSLMNNTIPQYYMDPLTGKTVFKGGKGTNNFVNQNGSFTQGGLGAYNDFKRQALGSGMPEDLANRYAYGQVTGRTTTVDNNFDGFPEQTRVTGQSRNPF